MTSKPAFGPARRIQSSKEVRRAYLRSDQRFKFTATQIRINERNDLLEERAKGIHAKEKRKRENKRKKEKELKDRQEKRKAVQDGKIAMEKILGKVRASQPRLNAFFQAPQSTKDRDIDLEKINLDINKHRLVTNIPDVQLDLQGILEDEKLGTQELSSVATSPSPCNISIATRIEVHNCPPKEAHRCPSPKYPHGANIQSSSLISPATQTQLDAQLSFDDSLLHCEISIDPVLLVELEYGVSELSQIHRLSKAQSTPSPRNDVTRKREYSVPPAVCSYSLARQTLAEMTPSKINVRATEKPGISPLLASDASPTRSTSQDAAHMIAMIATQDLEDEKDLEDSLKNKDNFGPQRAPDELKEPNVGANIDVLTPSGQTLGLTKAALRTAVKDEILYMSDDFCKAEDEFGDGLTQELLSVISAVEPLGATSSISALPAQPAISTHHDLGTCSVEDKQVSTYVLKSNSFEAAPSSSYPFNDVEDADLMFCAQQHDLGWNFQPKVPN